MAGSLFGPVFGRVEQPLSRRIPKRTIKAEILMLYVDRIAQPSCPAKKLTMKSTTS
jgi:hypothetical protein